MFRSGISDSSSASWSAGACMLVLASCTHPVKWVCSCAMVAHPQCPSSSWAQMSTKSFSSGVTWLRSKSSVVAKRMSMRPSSMNLRPCATASGVQSRSTSSPYSLLPMSAPRAMAMGSPTIPVPGIPTPMAFLRMFAESRTSMRAGTRSLHPFTVWSFSVARAQARATQMGSVQPMAGTTCRCTSAISFLRVLGSIMIYEKRVV